MAVLEQQETFSDINESSLSDLTTNPLLAGEVPGDEPDNEERTYHYVDGKTKGAKVFSTWAKGADAEQLTENELKNKYNNDAMLQETFESWDNYLGYMDDRQDLINSGEYNPDWYLDQSVKAKDPVFTLADGTTVAGEDWTPDMGDPVSVWGIVGATGGGSNEQAIVTAKQWAIGSDKIKGIFDQYATGVNNAEFGEFGHRSKGNDGYTWNGTDWVKTWEPQSVTGQLFQMAIAIGASVIMGPQLAIALGSKAAAAGVMSAFNQLGTTGEIDPKQALISAAIVYGGEQLGEIVAAASEEGGILADASEKLETFQNAISTGNDIADAAIQAGGLDALVQMVSNGDVDIKQAAIAAASAGGAVAFSQFVDYINAAPEDFGFASEEQWENTLEEIDTELEAEGLIEITPTGERKDVPDDVQDTLDQTDKDYGGFEEPPQSLEAYPENKDTLDSSGQITDEDEFFKVPEEQPQGAMEEELDFLEEQDLIDQESDGNFMGPKRTDAATYDPDSEVGQFIEGLSQDEIYGEVITGVTTGPDGSYITQDIDGKYALYKPESGRWQIVDVVTGEMTPYMGAGGNPYDPKSTQYNVYKDMDPLSRHWLAGGQLPSDTPPQTVVDFDSIAPETTEPETTEPETSQTEDAVEGAMPDVETSKPGGGDVTESTGGTPGGGPAGNADQTSGVPGSNLGFDYGGTSIGGRAQAAAAAQAAAQAAAAAAELEAQQESQQQSVAEDEEDKEDEENSDQVLDANGEIETNTTEDPEKVSGGLLTFGGESTSGGSQTNESGGAAGGGGAGEGDQTGGGGEGGTSGQNEGVGGGGAGAGTGAGAGDDAGTGGGVGGGKGEGTGGGVGDDSGGEGGAGGGSTPSSGGMLGGEGKFSPFYSGISYGPLDIPALIQQQQIDTLPAQKVYESMSITKGLFGDLI